MWMGVRPAIIQHALPYKMNVDSSREFRECIQADLDLCRQVAQCSSVHGSSAGDVKLWVFGGPGQIQADLLSNWHLTVSCRAWAHGLVRAGNFRQAHVQS